MYQATWYQRLLAFFIDQAVTGAFVMMALIVLSAFSSASEGIVLSFLLVISVVVCMMTPAFFMLRKGQGHGQTYGKTVMKLRVVREDGRSWKWYQAILREFVYKGALFFILVVFIPFVLIFFVIEIIYMKKHPGKSIHDRWSSSRVESLKKPGWKSYVPSSFR